MKITGVTITGRRVNTTVIEGKVTITNGYAFQRLLAQAGVASWPTVPGNAQAKSAGALQHPGRRHWRVDSWTFDDAHAPGSWWVNRFADGTAHVGGNPDVGETVEEFFERVRRAVER